MIDIAKNNTAKTALRNMADIPNTNPQIRLS